MLVILDSSVIISAQISSKESYTKDILRLAYEFKLTLITSSEAFAELKEALKAEKLKKFSSYKHEKSGAFIAWFKYNAQFVDISPTLIPSVLSRDINDTMYLVLAEVSNADFLVTVDKDLLVLKEIKNTKIVKPKEFINIVDREPF